VLNLREGGKIDQSSSSSSSSASASASSSSFRRLTLPTLHESLAKQGAAHFDPDGRAPLGYALVLLHSLQLEQVCDWLSISVWFGLLLLYSCFLHDK
jgi:hypothetical protein